MQTEILELNSLCALCGSVVDSFLREHRDTKSAEEKKKKFILSVFSVFSVFSVSLCPL